MQTDLHRREEAAAACLHLPRASVKPPRPARNLTPDTIRLEDAFPDSTTHLEFFKPLKKRTYFCRVSRSM